MKLGKTGINTPGKWQRVSTINDIKDLNDGITDQGKIMNKTPKKLPSPHVCEKCAWYDSQDNVCCRKNEEVWWPTDFGCKDWEAADKISYARRKL